MGTLFPQEGEMPNDNNGKLMELTDREQPFFDSLSADDKNSFREYVNILDSARDVPSLGRMRLHNTE
jgi:hypothetical protein